MLFIYENETDVDKKRILMRTPSYIFVTIPGVERAYTFYKRHSEHLQRALLFHDGNPIAMAASEVDMDLLNDLANAGIRFARTHSWEDVAEKGASPKVLICLPAGFRRYDRVATADGNSNMVIYSSLKDIVNHVKKAAALKTLIFVTPTSEESYEAE
ncbi:unnamed protein product [Heligmosomoides polygyrus]|uniref:LAL_C2 domain-containing protein n=1 Tax=Heligmosomoides polygyrus TaxID=6339 RepID=A0A183FFA8_HELPZ|nr:unnamed protein product [Heligmosomoides polygyrus]